MVDRDLIAFWIKSPDPRGPLGFGVTAWSVDDALAIVCAFDYRRFLPTKLNELQITKSVDIAELHHHVVANMGSIAVRGMWYPFFVVGVPQWAEEFVSKHDFREHSDKE